MSKIVADEIKVKKNGKEYIVPGLIINDRGRGRRDFTDEFEIRYGYYTGGSAGNFTISFDEPFSHDCLAVVHAQRKRNNGDYDKTCITGLSNTGFNMNSSSYQMNYYYIAIGY